MGTLFWLFDDIFDWLKAHETLTYCVSCYIGSVIGVFMTLFVVIPAINAP